MEILRNSAVLAILLFFACVFSACFFAVKAKVGMLVYAPFHYVHLIKEKPLGNEVLLLILSSIMLGAALGVYGYVTVNKKKNPGLLMFLASISAIFYLFFFSHYVAFFVSAGWFMMLLFFSKSISSNLEAYRKPKYFSITSGAVKSTFTIFSLMTCLGIFLFLQNNPNVTNSMISGFFQGVFQQSVTFQSQIRQAQLNFTMQTLDMIESILLTTSRSYLTPECSRQLTEMYRNIDNATREAILRRFEEENVTSTQQYVNYAVQHLGIYRELRTVFPVIFALSMLAIIETVKSLIIAPVAGMVFCGLNGRKKYATDSKKS